MKKSKLISQAIMLFILLGGVSCFHGVGAGVSIDVENITPKLIDEGLVYSAKFVCGTISDSITVSPLESSGQPLAPGTYFTAINIHNPNEDVAEFARKAVVTNSQGPVSARIGRLSLDTLGPNEGIEYDCSEISGLLELDSLPEFLKGFVVIRISPHTELDVTAVYTLRTVISDK